MPTPTPTNAQVSNWHKGDMFETLAVEHLRVHEGFTRFGESSTASVRHWTSMVAAAVRPTGETGIFEMNTQAEGLWVDPKGCPVWVECSGVWSAAPRPGFRRSDTTRKIAGTITCVKTLCDEYGVAPPRVLLITSHLPRRTSAAAAYLTWGVIRSLGERRCRIVVLDEDGQSASVPGEFYCRPAV